ncbi:MAG: ATP-dependent zinc metalloprotease FtsH [Spirochaetes bacterium]|nr:ATP-dependent zinc metalloprotease FtsH [Spirochaetota bacterium]
MSDNQNNKKNDPKLPPAGGSNRFLLILLATGAVISLLYFINQLQVYSTSINYDHFLMLVKEDKLYYTKDKPLLIFENGKIKGSYKEGRETKDFETTFPHLFDAGDLYNLLKEKGVIFRGAQEQSPFISLFIFNVLPIAVLIFIIWFMFRQFQGAGNKAFLFGKSKARKFESKVKVTFNDVAGIDEAKEELKEVIEFLKDPKKFTRIGAKIPKGVLLVGPPGTGKTLLARAVAGEADVSFYFMSGSDFVEMFVGVGASRVRDLFDTGRKNAPCILFIDELDAVGRTRGAGYGGGHDEREQTLNQLLVEMDGFDPTLGVILISATNRPDVLDPALLRPGRFDRQVVVDFPDVKGREEILKIHIKKVNIASNLDFTKIARATPGFTGADIANMINEAALLAARLNKSEVTMADFEEARDKVLMGVARKSKIIPENVKIITAYHEAGHTIINLFVENADPLHKVTIIPRGMALGLTSMLPENDIMLHTKDKILDRICIMMGGRAAEEIIFKEIDTGAANDISKSTELARKMVTQWGMSEKLGFITYGQKDEPIFIGKEIATHKDYSEKTAELIDLEIKNIIDTQYKRAIKIITENKTKLIKLADLLFEKETLDSEEIFKLLKIKPKRIAEGIK